jgi:hypothetical protein
MSQGTSANHPHVHDAQCGHTRIHHEGHTDYLHEGHLYSEQGGTYEEHVIAISETNPVRCDPIPCTGDHWGQEAIPHGDHTDILVGGHLHHVHGDHCDDHGRVTTVM